MKIHDIITETKQDKKPKLPAGAKMMNGLTIIPLDAFVEDDVTEGINHDRYLRSHGRKAKGQGSWMFTTKRMGEPSKDETVTVHGHLSDAGREAMKKLKAKEVYVMEAPGDFGLGASTRTASDDEMQAYAQRIKDKEKNKLDPYNMPYVHGSNIAVVNQEGKKYNLDALRSSITERPKKILKQNEKMQHSDGSSSIFFNVGLPALKGLAVNEQTGEFVIVDTCPGAGACKTFCYAMKGSYVMFKAVSMNQTRMLNFLLNDPDGFADEMSGELRSAQRKFAKDGTKVIVRWHDAGDFFSAQYLALAYKVARTFPNVDFYAYTKLADVASGDKPDNFKMNFSGGAKGSEEKQINFQTVKHSRVVPKNMFFDLISRKGLNLIKDAKGRMQFVSQENLDTFKQRLAQQYKIDRNSIITYDQMMATKDGGKPTWNVIVMPGDGDDSANRNDVLGSYLLFH